MYSEFEVTVTWRDFAQQLQGMHDIEANTGWRKPKLGVRLTYADVTMTELLCIRIDDDANQDVFLEVSSWHMLLCHYVYFLYRSTFPA